MDDSTKVIEQLSMNFRTALETNNVELAAEILGKIFQLINYTTNIPQ